MMMMMIIMLVMKMMKTLMMMMRLMMILMPINTKVSWMRRSGEDNPYLLTYGKLIYSSDVRYQIFHEANHDWKLQIQGPTLKLDLYFKNIIFLFL